MYLQNIFILLFYSREKAMDCVMYVRQCTYSSQYMRKMRDVREKGEAEWYWKKPARTKSRTHGAVHNEMANSVFSFQFECVLRNAFKLLSKLKFRQIYWWNWLLQWSEKEKCGTALGNLPLSFIHFCQLFCITWSINFIHLFTLIALKTFLLTLK